MYDASAIAKRSRVTRSCSGIACVKHAPLTDNARMAFTQETGELSLHQLADWLTTPLGRRCLTNEQRLMRREQKQTDEMAQNAHRRRAESDSTFQSLHT